jgi:hypothetical protein
MRGGDARYATGELFALAALRKVVPHAFAFFEPSIGRR